MEWTTACPNWESRLLNKEGMISFPPLFPEEAASGLAIFNELRLVDVQGSPTYGEIGRPWIQDFVGSIFGAYDAETGRRLISEFFMLIAKKNGKSSAASAIMITALLKGWRQSAEYLIISPTIEIAMNSFLPARDMIRADEELSDLLHVQDHIRTITHRGTGATLKVVAAENDTVGGKKATGILLDEIWLLGKRPNAENMIREACGGLAARPEGFVIYLSTQSDEAPAGVFKQKLDYARGVRDGRIKDNRFLPVIYEFPDRILKDKKHLDPKYFFVTNPNLGASVDEEFLIREFHKAEESGEESMCGFLAKHLNVEIGIALKSSRWAGADFWEQEDTGLTLEKILEKSDVVTIGGDGGGLDDLLGICVLGRDAEDSRRWMAWIRAWAHPIALERRKSEKSRYLDFRKDGDLVVVDEVGQDIEQFCQIVKQCEASGLLDRIGVDPAGIGDIVDAIVAEGIDHDRVVGIPQGWRMNGAIKSAERRLAEGQLVHCNQPLMAWCVGNARVEPKGNAIVITKQASGTGKIDPLIALLAAVALMAMNPEARQKKSFWESPEAEILTW
jgi:phage terminase large subunit-like protein